MARQAKRKTSTLLIRNLDRTLRLAREAERPMYCFQLDPVKLKYTDEQRETMNEAQALIVDATEKVKIVYRDMIGDAIVREISAGEWR